MCRRKVTPPWQWMVCREALGCFRRNSRTWCQFFCWRSLNNPERSTKSSWSSWSSPSLFASSFSEVCAAPKFGGEHRSGALMLLLSSGDAVAWNVIPLAGLCELLLLLLLLFCWTALFSLDPCNATISILDSLSNGGSLDSCCCCSLLCVCCSLVKVLVDEEELVSSPDEVARDESTEISEAGESGRPCSCSCCSCWCSSCSCWSRFALASDTTESVSSSSTRDRGGECIA
mmetsp:Transcript_20324/g.56535  ORF Transcript_20324/g.56535 Transcript_20324/m.56535 type:complete len:231 (+) Transcript_20324:2084-2776(+)